MGFVTKYLPVAEQVLRQRDNTFAAAGYVSSANTQVFHWDEIEFIIHLIRGNICFSDWSHIIVV